MDPELKEHFFREVTKAFDFLVKEGGFDPPQLTVDPKTGFAQATFTGKHVAVVCWLDHRDEDVSCRLVRVVGGKMAPLYFGDDDGRISSEYVSEFVRRRGVEGPLFTKVTGLPLRDRIPITLGDFARMLREHGQEVIADSPRVFEY